MTHAAAADIEKNEEARQAVMASFRSWRSNNPGWFSKGRKGKKGRGEEGGG